MRDRSTQNSNYSTDDTIDLSDVIKYTKEMDEVEKKMRCPCADCEKGDSLCKDSFHCNRYRDWKKRYRKMRE